MNHLDRTLLLCPLVVAVFSVTIIAQSNDVSYEELMTLKASCAPADTCQKDGDPDLVNSRRTALGNDPRYAWRNQSTWVNSCDCDPECAEYNTCCVDSPHRDTSRTTASETRQKEVCTKVYGTFVRSSNTASAYFMINKCAARWNGIRGMKTLCEQGYRDPRDPMLLIPASSIQRKTTYKNVFCGICNNVDPDELMLWNLTLKLDRKVLKDANNLSEQLVYRESRRQWGRWESRDGKAHFHVVDLIPMAPENLNQVSKKCIPSLVSRCSPSWKNETIRRKCASYLGAIYVSKKGKNDGRLVRYRNIHCAMCNYVSLETDVIICKSYPPKPVLPFTLLLDVNRSDGNKVGRVTRCRSGQAYDPFFRKCRNVECGLPGYVVSRNRCVRGK